MVTIIFCLTLFIAQTNILAETYNMRIANALTEEHTHSQVLLYFADRVNELTEGQLNAKVYLNGILGDERSVMEQVQMGSIEFTRTGYPVLSGLVPEIDIFGLPYLFDNVDHMYAVIDGPIGKTIEDKLKNEGLIILGWFDYGARSILAKKPIRKPEDLNGLRIRVQESPLNVDTFKAIGASPVPLPYADQYSALDSGVIDGTENAPDTIYDGRFHEVAHYYSLTEHFIQPTVFYMSKSVFDKLPEDIQKAIIQAGEDSVSWIKDHQPAKIEEGLKLMEEEGATIVKDVDKQAFREEVLPLQTEYAEKFSQLLIEVIYNTK